MIDRRFLQHRLAGSWRRVGPPGQADDGRRPVVSTALPECRLYRHLFDVAETPADFVAAARRVVDLGSDDGRAALRWEAARAGTWERTAATLLRQFQSRLAPG